MVLYDSAASVSFSKIFLLILMSLALTVLCVDLQYNEYSSTLLAFGQFFINIVQNIPLPEFLQETLSHVVSAVSGGMYWLNQTQWPS